MDILDNSIQYMKGIGPAKAELLKKLGIYTILDMLYFLPRDYKDFSKIVPVAAIEPGEVCAFVRISTQPRVFYANSGINILSVNAHDETGKCKLVWYNQAFRKNQIKSGESYIVFGKVSLKNGMMQFENPDIEPAGDLGEGVSARGILPVYPLTAGLGQKTLRAATKFCLEESKGQFEEIFPDDIRKKHGLCEINYALSQVHFPSDMQSLETAKRRLAIEEVIYFSEALNMFSSSKKGKKSIVYKTSGMLEEFVSMLSFAPTNAQMKVMKEIQTDMSKIDQMNRLIQGDVGSGKTILAFYAIFIAIKNGKQAALMAPTEILAMQHLESAKSVFKNNFGIELITGSMKAKEKREAYDRITSGESLITIGTHALLQDTVAFENLGLIITDEQHRFGVKQRAVFSKGEDVDTIIMSATPIPRTLTLILYGDLDISTVDELPPGRKPIITRLVPDIKRNDMYKYIANKLSKGEQVYVICPVIEHDEESGLSSAEAIYDELQKGALRDFSVGLLHGRLKSDEKDSVLSDFRKNNINVLVSTTVVEVGVDVPNANTIVIENADRFGLAQLHQLRGRVGRGDVQAWCFLLPNSQSQTSMDRMEVMCNSNDGFKIAQSDLELRGPGEFFGTRQSGGNTQLLRMVSDMQMLREAQTILGELKNLKYKGSYNKIISTTKKKYQEKFKNIALN